VAELELVVTPVTVLEEGSSAMDMTTATDIELVTLIPLLRARLVKDVIHTGLNAVRFLLQRMRCGTRTTLSEALTGYSKVLLN